MTKRFDWRTIAGIGAAGLLVAAPAVRADHHEAKTSGASGMEQGASGKESEARGTGQAGTSTGARPGEVTGAPGAAGGASEQEQRAQVGAQEELSGKVEKYDREKRTLSLSDSDKELKLTDDTEVTKDGSRVSPGQIMEGDEVRASLSGSGEAVRIEIGSTQGGTGAGSTSGPGSSGTTSDAPGGSPKSTGAGSASDTAGGSTATPPPKQ
jgi:hypothetical protein